VIILCCRFLVNRQWLAFTTRFDPFIQQIKAGLSLSNPHSARHQAEKEKTVKITARVFQSGPLALSVSTILALVTFMFYPSFSDGQTTLTPPINTSTGYFYLGPSKGTTNGGPGGLAAMNSLCEATYGFGTRMCTSQEFLTSPLYFPTSELRYAMWAEPSSVRYVIVPGAPPGFVGGLYAIDYSSAANSIPDGIPAPGYMDCGQWKDGTSQFYGLIVSNVGSAAMGQCNAVNPVACCGTVASLAFFGLSTPAP